MRLLAVERYRRGGLRVRAGGRPDGPAQVGTDCGDNGICGQPQGAAGASDAEWVRAGQGVPGAPFGVPDRERASGKGAGGRRRVNAGAAATGGEEGEAEEVRRGFGETGAVRHSPATHRPTARRHHVRIATPLRQFELGSNVEPRITRLVGMMREGAASGDLRTWSSSRRAAASPISRIGWRTVVKAG